MTINSTSGSKPFVYIFSSASRPLYRQNILDSLCIPNGYIMHYRYEQKHVHEEVWRLASERPATLEGSTGICVFVDQEDVQGKAEPDVHGLYPLREIKVRRIETDGGVLHVYFEVTGYVHYATGTGYTSSSYESNLRDLLKTHIPPTDYIALSTKPAQIRLAGGDAQEQAIAWSRIVDQLLDVKDFKSSLFYRVTGLRRLLLRKQGAKSGEELEQTDIAVSEVLPLQSGYELPSGRAYGLSLSFYRRDKTEKAVQNAILTPSLDATHFSYNPGPIQVKFRYDKHELNLISKQVSEDCLTLLQIRLDEANAKAQADIQARPEGPVAAPEPKFLMRLKAPWWQKWAFFVFFVGTLISAAALAVPDSDVGKALGVVIGSSFTTGALIWLNRKVG